MLSNVCSPIGRYIELMFFVRVFLGFRALFAVVMFPLPVRSIIFAFAQISEVYHKSEVYQVNRADAWQGRTNRECVPILA